MQAHAVIHTGDKPFQCTICEKRFNNKANLNKHKLTHGNQRPYVCNICGQTYRQSYDLKRHTSTHTDPVKSFTCLQCGKIFARKSYLQRHLLIHTNERKYVCSHCGRKFLQRGQLNFHVKNQHKVTNKESFDSKTDADIPDSTTPGSPDCPVDNSEVIEPRDSTENDNPSINDSNKVVDTAVKDSEKSTENIVSDLDVKRGALFSKDSNKLSDTSMKHNDVVSQGDQISNKNFDEIIPLNKDGQQRSYVDLLLSPDDNDRALTKTLTCDSDKELARKNRAARNICDSLSLPSDKTS